MRHGLEGNFELEEDDVGRLDRRPGAFDVIGGESVVRPSRNGDRVFPGRIDEDQRHAGRALGRDRDEVSLDPLGLKGLDR